KTPTPTLQFKTGDGTYGAISITVAQKPSLALTNMRCTIVDGVEGNNARYIEIDEEGSVNVDSVISEIIPQQTITEFQELSEQENGIGIESGHFFGYRTTFVDLFGVEGRPSPLIYNNTRFENEKTQQVYSGFNYSGSLISKSQKFILNNFIKMGNLGDNVSKVNIYRSEAKYTQGFLPPTGCTFIDSKSKQAIGDSYVDASYNDGSGGSVDTNILPTMKADTLTIAGQTLLVTGTKGNISFPIDYNRYVKIIITNDNSRNYINCVIKLNTGDVLPSDLSSLGHKGYRFYMDDFITPIPCANESGSYFHLRIPIIYSRTDTVIYLAYYPDTVAECAYPPEHKTYMSGYPFNLNNVNLLNFYEETGQRFNNRYNIKDEQDVIVLGGDHLDNAYSAGSTELSNNVQISTISSSDSSPNYVHKYYGFPDYPSNVITLTGEESIKIPSGILQNDTSVSYTFYGYFVLNTTSSERTTIFCDFADGDSVGINYRYVGTNIVFSFVVNNSSPGGFSDVSLNGGQNSHYFIYCSVSKKSSQTTCYIKNLGNGEERYYKGSTGRLFTTREVPSRSFHIHGSTIDVPKDTALMFSDLHFHDGMYLSNKTFIENICNTGNVFDTGFIGYNGETLKNISIEEPKDISAQTSIGTIRWSDNAGLTFPTLNELVVGREVIKIVPRLGSKDAYESIVDVYTKNGIYILSIDKLSSASNLIPLTGESGTFILQNKDSIVTVDSSNYFVSNNTLYQQTGESFTDLSSGKVNIDCDKVTYFPEYKAIGMAKTGNSSVLMYDIEKSIYFKQDINGVLDFADVSEDGKRMVIFDTSVKTLSDSLVTTGLKVKSKRFYVGLASLIRFNIEFEFKRQDSLFTIRSIFENTPRIKKFAYIETDGAIALNIDSNKWYHFPNGLICEYFELELFNYRGIKKIEIEYRPRGRR
ncbi:MAG: hypothetical protein GX025_10280, partial [Clostridiales bacterium]|nr:hypothetical protein [Clostridiales bacterium]